MRPRILLALSFFALAGCGGSGAAIVPTENEARQALETTLNAWKSGQPIASLAQGTPKVEANDFEWEAGKKLADFSIGSESPGVGTKNFSVKLTIAPSETKDVTYMILGKDPFRILRDEDYERAMNMENRPGPARGKGKR